MKPIWSSSPTHDASIVTETVPVAQSMVDAPVVSRDGKASWANEPSDRLSTLMNARVFVEASPLVTVGFFR